MLSDDELEGIILGMIYKHFNMDLPSETDDELAKLIVKLMRENPKGKENEK